MLLNITRAKIIKDKATPIAPIDSI